MSFDRRSFMTLLAGSAAASVIAMPDANVAIASVPLVLTPKPISTRGIYISGWGGFGIVNHGPEILYIGVMAGEQGIRLDPGSYFTFR